MDVQVQVVGKITSKSTSNGGTKFDIPLSNGSKPSTFDAVLATKVANFGGQPFTARLEEKPSNRGGAPYVNITAAAGPGETLPPELPQAGTPIGQSAASAFVPQGNVVQGTASTPIVAAAQGGGKKFTEADSTRITKLAVIGYAYSAVSALFHGAGPEALAEVVEHADALAKKLYAEARSHEPGVVPQQQQATPAVAVEASPQAVVAYVAEQAGTPLVQVGSAAVEPTGDVAVLPWSN